MSDKKKIYLQVFSPYLISIGIAIICYLVIHYTLHPFCVTGMSMEPTLKSGEIVVCSTKFSPDLLKRGDIIVFKYGQKTYIKRIIALPGETVKIADGKVYINGEELASYVFEDILDAGILADGGITLAEDSFFCMGDNRNHSNDCRNFGPIRYEDIKYRVVRRLFDDKDIW